MSKIKNLIFLLVFAGLSSTSYSLLKFQIGDEVQRSEAFETGLFKLYRRKHSIEITSNSDFPMEHIKEQFFREFLKVLTRNGDEMEVYMDVSDNRKVILRPVSGSKKSRPLNRISSMIKDTEAVGEQSTKTVDELVAWIEGSDESFSDSKKDKKANFKVKK